MPGTSVDILQGLLDKDPKKRLGAGPSGAEDIMHHDYFEDLSWDDVYHKRVQATFIPDVKDPLDRSNLDPEVTRITPVLTPVQNGTFQSSQRSSADLSLTFPTSASPFASYARYIPSILGHRTYGVTGTVVK